MTGIKELIGVKILKTEGDEVDTASIDKEGSVVGLYFSAHWCPPCRGFTPELAKWYTKFKGTDKGDKLYIVFVSSDRDEDSFKEYFKEMPWHALPYGERDTKTTLSKKYGVSGIPSLVFLEGTTGKLITKDGRSAVDNDPEGAEFPWTPPTLDELLCGSVKGKQGDVNVVEALEGKITGIYFSAHWCPPCRGFTPKFVDTYNKVKKAGKNFEVLFVSWDENEDEFEEYYEEMPWLAILPKDKRVAKLNGYFEVEGIPSLVLLDENKQVISNRARGAVETDPEGKEFPWYPKPVNELTGAVAGDLNESACLIYFTGAKEAEITRAKTWLEEVADRYVAERKPTIGTANEIKALSFMYEGTNTEDLTNRLKQFCHVEKEGPFLFLCDMTSDTNYKFVPECTEVTKEAIASLVADFKASKITMEEIK